MHSGAVPVNVLAQRLAVEVDVHAVLFAQADHQVAGDPHIVADGRCTLGEDLEFPLSLGDFGIDPFQVDAASRQMSMCSSTISRAMSPTLL